MSNAEYDRFVDEETGQAMSDAQWLDVHFEACASGYRKCVELAPFASGMRVLDAGCGSGGFLPWLAERIGPTGSILAVDLAPSNVEVTGRRVADWGLSDRVQTQVADLLELPFESRFDAVWCANVSELFDDAQFGRLLDNLERAVVPGGYIVLKGFDSQLMRFHPERIQDAIRSVFHAARGTQHDFATMAHATRRMAGLRFIMTQRGYSDVAQRDVQIDHIAPEDGPKRAWCEQMLTLFAGLSKDLGLEEDVDFWNTTLRFDDEGHPLNTKMFGFTEFSTVAFGRTPRGAQ